jgi:hypothetical protein
MNKFAGLADVKLKALEPESEKTTQKKPEEKKAEKPVSNQPNKQVNKKAGKLAIKKTSSEESLVGVTIKIPENKRIWWNVQAKLQRTTVTDAIIEALDKRFGEPNFEG